MTMKHITQIRGSILATVLVVCTLMLVALFALISLVDTESYLYYGTRYRKQKQAFLDAAFLLYENDPELVGITGGEYEIKLFEDDPSSRVTLSRSFWGLYEVVRASSGGEGFRAAKLFGHAQNAGHYALYVCDNRRAVTLTGKTNIRGNLCLPREGILYGQMQSAFFSGKKIEPSAIRNSNPEFPPLNIALIDSVKKWRTGEGEEFDGSNLSASFFDPTVNLKTGNLQQVKFRGNIILRANSKIVIDHTAQLEDVILIAPSITISKGFSGTVQIFVSDTVIIESGVMLNYPSGILIVQAASGSYVEISESSRVDGYVVIHPGTGAKEPGRAPNYKQCAGAGTSGLIYVDGIAQVQGSLVGSLWVNQPNYYTPQGYYTHTFHELTVQGADQAAYPLWFEDDHSRKTVKWLH